MDGKDVFDFLCPPPPDTDTAALRLATDSLQNQERLNLVLKKSSVTSTKNVGDKSRSAIDRLREIKADIEGSSSGYVAMAINETPLQELRQLTLMHVPSSITEEVRERFQRLIHQCLDGRCRDIVCGVLSICPWYWATQRERGEQARHNVIVIVYISFDNQFISPVNPHVQAQAGVIDLGWLHVVELSHFVQALMKGRTRYVELLFCHQGALVLDSEPWQQLRLQRTEVTGLRGFIEACRGQAVGGISKKKKNGGLKLKETTTFYQLCESFSNPNLNMLTTLSSQRPISSELQESSLSDIAKQGFEKLKLLYQDPDVLNHEIFVILQTWQEEIMKKLKGFKFADTKTIEAVFGPWMMATRLAGRQLSKLTYLSDEYSTLVSLMSDIGGPVSRMKPQQILLVARAGSWMYGLSTPDSDVDYMIIYAELPEVVFSSCRKLSESVENRGPTKQFEYGAYEARLFCEMVLKGSVVILELLFVDGHAYESPAWKALSVCRKRFLTECGIQQYLGLVKNNFNLIKSEKHGGGTSRDRKLFYQIFHKLNSLEYFLQELPPPVRCSDDIRDFILRVRTQPWEGDLSRENLHTLATEKYNNMRQHLVDRQKRLPENVDYRLMSNWLQSVRGIPLVKEEIVFNTQGSM
ncbi:uncharacterized protein LOC121373009 [Gigantopelta aegis]|uniref:uncharacterized protein LOC121373009 n=1 Tax=Gigantopelta aegis TaxID=1735272 RepID=UPI001B88C52A|nr:uncharacterized protein LOC121373009 [Gigantopelta aegis]